jgi:hypothetical protein
MRFSSGRMVGKVPVAVTAIGIALVCGVPTAGAASRTTDPSSGLEYVFVQMTDSKIVFTEKSAYCCDAPNRSPGTPRAWSKLAFRVTNAGKKPHNFTLYGKTTRRIQPGKTVNSAQYDFLYRGKYVYRSTLNPSPGLRGIWTVY